MSGRLQITGLQELIQEITRAPETLRAQARGIVRDTTEAAAKDIAGQYPDVTGALRRRVRTEYPSSDVVIGVVVSAAPHSHLYEFGTTTRKNARGANRGRMPDRPVTPGVARRHRDTLFGRLAQMMRDQGYQVDGV